VRMKADGRAFTAFAKLLVVVTILG
jgi:hypothetical protein